MSSPPKTRENSRQYSPAFSRKVKASVLRTMARKSNKYGKEKDCEIDPSIYPRLP